MNKIKNYLATPITWGAYWKLAGICSVISVIYYVILYVCMGLIDNPIDIIKEKLSGRKYDED